MIKILTDSSCVIPYDEARELNVDIIPLGITFGTEAYMDGVDITTEQFYGKLVESKVFPHTSQPSQEELEEHFERARAEGYTLLFLPLSSKISGTYESALNVKREGNYDNVYVYDTRCTTVMLELLVREAAKRTNLSIEELIAYLDDLRSRARLIAGIDTLEYLAKGGRLNTATAVVGTLFKVKPIIIISLQGTIDVIAKRLGVKQGIRAVAEMLDMNKVDPEYGVRFLYSMNKENSKELIERIGLSEDKIVELTDIGSTVGAHIGPNAYGYVYVEKK